MSKLDSIEISAAQRSFKALNLLTYNRADADGPHNRPTSPNVEVMAEEILHSGWK